MRAMVLAAGLGTRLRPLTFELPKPMVPVLDRPVMAHILDHLRSQGCDEVIANLHYFPETIRAYFGDEIIERYEPELTGTAGGVRKCADFLSGGDDDSFLVISGDALTDLNLRRFINFHRKAGGVATLAAKQVVETSEYGVIVADREGRISGFQEKPDPAEALSTLANCGIYLFRKEIFDYFPEKEFVDWAMDVFPVLLENDVAFHVHDIGDEYWNDVGSLDELRAGTFDALTGELKLQAAQAGADGSHFGEGTVATEAEVLEGPVWVGNNVTLGGNVQLQGPVVIGDNATIGSDVCLRDSIVFPGTSVDDGAIIIGAIVGHAGIVEALPPRQRARSAT